MCAKFLDQLLGEAEKREKEEKKEVKEERRSKKPVPVPVKKTDIEEQIAARYSSEFREREEKLKKVIQKQSEIIASIYSKNKDLVLDVLDELDVSLEELKEVMEGLKLKV
jgi:hypothetical protein